MTQKNTILTDTVYEKTKSLALLLLPFFGVSYLILARIFLGDANDWILGGTLLFILFLGMSLKSSSKNYYASPYAYDGEMVVIADGGGVRTFSLEVNGDPDELAYKSSITFKVRKTEAPEPPEH